MRDIKFRLWNPSRKVLTVGTHLNTLLMTTDMDFVTAFNQNEMVWMQYTGLNDKYGKEIYEGDIITDGSYVGMPAMRYEGVVGFLKGAFVIVKTNCDCAGCLNSTIDGDVEIIGNIFENSKLLQQ